MTNLGRHIKRDTRPLSAETIWEARAETGTRKSEVGFTLQTLIVTAVLVLVAVGASLGLLAVTSSSSDDFEEAGKTGVEARCAPNEVKNPELEARGVRGINPTYREIEADVIGCDPICGTWEYYDTGRAAEGIGGPDGNGGLYSTDSGCFAPCYWNYWFGRDIKRPLPAALQGNQSRLRYWDDDRAPVANQVRLGVNYRRSADLTESLDVTKRKDLQLRNDLWRFGSGNAISTDGKPYISTRAAAPNGPRDVVGTLPLAPEMLAIGLPTVFKPNWITRGTDPGPGNRENTQWVDEDWEVRADPNNKECTIVNIALDDRIVCSSEWRTCATGP